MGTNTALRGAGGRSADHRVYLQELRARALSCVVTPYVAFTLIGCVPDVPQGVYACERDGDCPPDMVCRLTEGLCYRTRGSEEEDLRAQQMLDGSTPDGEAAAMDMMSTGGGGATGGEPTGGSAPDVPEVTKCEPGEPGRCTEEGNPETCGEDGSWMVAEPCQEPSAICDQGRCVACAGDDRRCASDGVTPEACVDGSWVAQVACEGGEVCVTGACQVCDPNGEVIHRCHDGRMQVCGSGATWEDDPSMGPCCIEGQPCDDGVACTTADTCTGGVCAGSADDGLCDDEDVCTDDTCDAVNGCQHANNASPCDDRLGCTANDKCQNGACRGDDTCTEGFCDGNLNSCRMCASPSECDDSNPCTDDVCAGGACLHSHNTAPCDDGIACTTADACSGGACTGTPTNALCDDGNVCTDDTCDRAAGCVRTNHARACSDGKFCNGTETCKDGACGGSTGNPCAGSDGDANCKESCNEATDMCNGNDPDGSSCNDGLYCNGTDSCSGGTCSSHANPPNVSDGIACTVDSCVETVPHDRHLAQNSSCDNGNPCDGSEKCDVSADCVTTPLSLSVTLTRYVGGISVFNALATLNQCSEVWQSHSEGNPYPQVLVGCDVDRKGSALEWRAWSNTCSSPFSCAGKTYGSPVTFGCARHPATGLDFVTCSIQGGCQ